MSEFDSPAWAREDAFPAKPDLGAYGSVDGSGNAKAFTEFAELRTYLASGRGKLGWVWIPEREHLIAPEECPELAPSMRKRFLLLSKKDQAEARRNLLIFGVILVWAVGAAFLNGGVRGVVGSQVVGMAALLFAFFAVIPWWQGFRGRKDALSMTAESLTTEIPEARFELWLESQKSWLTYGFLGLLSIIGLLQFLAPGHGIELAGLVKPRYHAGEWWRIFTGAMLHGNVIHFFMNAAAFWYLGRRLEIMARWPHLAGVSLVSMLGAGLATVYWLPTATSVGVSGVVCGQLGFLLVFEELHKKLVPSPARRRLFGLLISLVVLGAIGFKFVDNAAHFGGLIAGAIYAAVVFPKSSAPHRPKILITDLVIGVVSLAVILLAGLLAIYVLATVR